MMASAATNHSVLVTRELPDELLESLRKRKNISLTCWSSADSAIPRDALLQQVKGKSGILCLLTDKIDKDVLDAAGEQLKIVSTMSVGYDHVDIAACRERSICVGYTPDVLTEATADLTLGLLLATSRRFAQAKDAVHKGLWGTWTPFWLCGKGLAGSTVGLVGMGRIGEAVAQRLLGFAPAQVVYTCPSGSKPAVEEKLQNKSTSLRHVGFDELLQVSDFVVVCCRLSDDTRHLFNKEAFAAMKSTAYFVNTSRGDVVDQNALYSALKEGEIAGAGLDVTSPEPLSPEHQLLQLENCLVLPHIGSATMETREAMSRLAVDNLLAGLDGRPLPAQVP